MKNPYRTPYMLARAAQKSMRDVHDAMLSTDGPEQLPGLCASIMDALDLWASITVRLEKLSILKIAKKQGGKHA
jgi:hypothetical protein